jgi:hypothetical protein
MTTRNILSEEINRIYSRFLDKDNKKLDDREVSLYISQVVNSLFKIESIQRGSIVGTAIATYELPREEDDTFFVKLTVAPISLPKEQGVHRVYPKGCPWKAYIPILSGDFDIAQGTPASFLEGQIGYYQDGMKLRFTRQVPEDITVKLVVNDPNQEDGNLPLPIPADMETQVIQGVFQLLGFGQISQAELNSKSERIITNERERG